MLSTLESMYSTSESMLNDLVLLYLIHLGYLLQITYNPYRPFLLKLDLINAKCLNFNF